MFSNTLISCYPFVLSFVIRLYLASNSLSLNRFILFPFVLGILSSLSLPPDLCTLPLFPSYLFSSI